MKTLILTCIQCDEDFEFSADEQEKYNQRGFDPPLRCSICRKNKDKKPVFEEKKKFKDKKKQYRLKFDEKNMHF